MSTEATDVEVVDPLGARHDQLVGMLAQGVRDVCVALWSIRQENTYTARGFKSFGDFLRSLHYSAATGRLWANIGPLIQELRKTGEEHLISHPDVVRPIALLLSPQRQDEAKQRRIIVRQAEIVRRAAAVARRGMEPFTEQVVERVAKLHYGIKPREEYRAEKRAQRSEEPAALDTIEMARRRRQRLELAFATILDYEAELRRSGDELAELRNITGFEGVLLLFIDARDA
jgi:hypothetical protein